MKRILINDYGGNDFSLYLAKTLARRGYEVFYSFCRGAKKTEIDGGDKVKIIPLNPIRIEKRNLLFRWLLERRYGLNLSNLVRMLKPEVILSANTPLDAQKQIFKTSKKTKSKFIFWLQDINSIATTFILKDKIPLVGGLIGKYYRHTERAILRKSDFVIPISPDFITFLDKWKVNRSKIKVIENWASLKDFRVESKRNYWSIKHNFNDKFVFLISGNIGFKHHPEIILNLAGYFRNCRDIRVVVASEGFVVEWLKKQKELLGLSNLIILPYQQKKDFPFMLASADVLFSTLSDEAGLYSAPSRVLTYMCAKKPILFIAPKSNLISRILKENMAGLVVNTDDYLGAINEAKRLFCDKPLRNKLSKNARKYAEKNFNIEEIADRFEILINSKI